MSRLYASVSDFAWLRAAWLWLSAPLLAAIGIYASVVTFQQMTPQRELKAHGIQAVAQITDAELRTRKNGSQYYRVDLAWRDAQGKEHSLKDVRLSFSHSRKLISAYNDIRGRTLEFKYLPERPDLKPMFLDDPAHPEDDFSGFLIFLGLAIFGLWSTARMYWPLLRQR